MIKTLVLTDLVDSTRLFGALGDRRGGEVSARHDRLVRDLVVELGGREIDKSDGFLLLFERPIEGVRFCLGYHRALAELSRGEGVHVEGRAAVHLGEISLRENVPEDVARGAKPIEVEGLAKSLAARLMGLAQGGQTLLTQSAFDLARRGAVGGGEVELRWLSHGPYLFKGIEEPLEVFEVGEPGRAPLAAPAGSAKAQRAVRPGDEITLGWRAAQGQRIPLRPGWVLREKLGEGGFGDIWLATHEKTGEKRVFKFCYDAERLRALRREVTLFRLLRETLGHRDDIGRILDWNFDEAPYSLELDYSEAGSLVSWAEEQGGIAEIPLETRLEIVAQVAEALAAAHSVGVLHKDVKPANILISKDHGGKPRAVLTDFGIGALTDHSVLAAQGITSVGMTGMTAVTSGLHSSTGGTHVYMAPELLEGKAATIQADIYALGVMLYQLVVDDLTRVLAPGWERDVSDELLREDIARFADGVPEHRPRSALEVADSLRRLEERRAEREAERRAAREAERSHRLRRLLATVAAATTVVLVVVSYLAVQANAARKDALQRREQADDLIDFMLFDMRGGLESIGRLDLLAKVAEKAQGYFVTLPVEDDAARRRHATALLNIGDVWLDQGETDAALEAYRSARTTFEDLAAANPGDVDAQLDVATSRFKIATALQTRGEIDAALALHQTALSDLERLASPEPSDWRVTLNRARLSFEISTISWFYRAADDAQEPLEKALELAEKAAALAPGEEKWQALTLVIDSQVLRGHVHSFHDERAAALRSYRIALDAALELSAADPANLNWKDDVAAGWTRISQFLDDGEAPTPIDALNEARAIYEQLVAADASNLRWQEGLGRNLLALGFKVSESGDFAAALETLRTARDVVSTLVERDPDNTVWQDMLAVAYTAIAKVHLTADRPRQALGFHQAARDILERLVGQDPDDVAQRLRLGELHVELGDVYRVLGELDEARREWQLTIDITAPISDQLSAPQERAVYARALLSLDRVEEAAPIVEDLLARGHRDPPFLSLLREKGLLQPDT